MRHLASITIRLHRFQWFLTLINILGLTTGIVCAIFIFLWVDEEKSYDKMHPDSDRLYRIESLMDFATPTLWTVTPDLLVENLLKDFPEIEAGTRLMMGYKIIVANEENSFYEDNLLYVSPTFLNLLYYPGSAERDARSLKDPFILLISQSMAKKYFGSENPVGKGLTINNRHHFTVAGTFPDYPLNSHLKIDFLASFETLLYTGERLQDWGRYDFPSYIRLNKGVDPGAFQVKVADYISRFYSNSKTKLQLQLVKDIHLFSSSGEGSITKVRISMLIGILILSIAFINFINISTSQSIRRQKEISIRKIVGASRRNLAGLVYFELGFLTIIAWSLSIFIAWILLPVFNNFIGKQILATTFFQHDLILLFSGLILLLVLLAGLYPAVFLSSFRPIELLNKRTSIGNRNWVRKSLVILQFSVSVVLILSTLVIHSQFQYIQKKNLGFSKENLMLIKLPRTTGNKSGVLVNRLTQISGSGNLAVSSRILANMGTFREINKWEGNTDGNKLMVNEMDIDHRFVSLLGMEILEGRDFREGDNPFYLIINQEAAAKMGFDNAVGKRIYSGDDIFEVVGVVKDFHFKPLNDKIAPILLHFSPEGSMIYVKLIPERLATDIMTLQQAVKEILPESPFVYSFLDEEIDSYYSNDRKDGNIISLFSLIAILTSCLGILGLSVFLAQSKTKEIGIRKALGASRSNVIFHVVKEILILVVVANVIGLIAGWFFIENWLENYTYRIHPGILHFGGTLVLSVSLALAAISFFAFRSASVNPMKALRTD
jgi:putative ABC transport system permease protein